VTYRGLVVGTVLAIDPLTDHVRLTVRLTRPDVPVHANDRLRVTAYGVFGQSRVELIGGAQPEPLLPLRAGHVDSLAGAPYVPADTALTRVATQALDSVKELVAHTRRTPPPSASGIFGDSLVVAIVIHDRIAPFIVQVRTNRRRADSTSFRRYASSELERIGYHLSDSWTHRQRIPILVVPCYVDDCVSQSKLNDYPLDRGLLFEKADTLGARRPNEQL
jgi:hypothetical protein